MILVITEINVIITDKNHPTSIYLLLSKVGASVAPSQDNLNLLLCLHLNTSSLRSLSSHHHHHVMLVALIFLTLSRHFSLPFIASGRSSGLHPVSSHSCWMYVRAGRPAFARSCVGIHKSTSLMSSSLLLQQCPACLVRLTWIVFVWHHSQQVQTPVTLLG